MKCGKDTKSANYGDFYVDNAKGVDIRFFCDKIVLIKGTICKIRCAQAQTKEINRTQFRIYNKKIIGGSLDETI